MPRYRGRPSMRRRVRRLAVATLLLFPGCATVTPSSSRTWLTFLEDGRTTRETIVHQLGAPLGTYDGERILSYTLGGDKDEGYIVVNASIASPDTKYNLVLVFDEHDVLARHALIRIR